MCNLCIQYVFAESKMIIISLLVTIFLALILWADQLRDSSGAWVTISLKQWDNRSLLCVLLCYSSQKHWLTCQYLAPRGGGRRGCSPQSWPSSTPERQTGVSKAFQTDDNVLYSCVCYSMTNRLMCPQLKTLIDNIDIKSTKIKGNAFF